MKSFAPAPLRVGARARRGLEAICDTFAPGHDGLPPASELGVADAFLEAASRNPRVAERRQLRAVLPVGGRDLAQTLLERIVSDAPAERRRPPRRVLVKSPLRYHHLSWGRTDTCVVTTSGRVARTTDWVPLAKVQSLRRVQGPVQRRLHLATVHLDTAGRNVHAAIRDRDEAEAERILDELIDLCRAARRTAA